MIKFAWRALMFSAMGMFVTGCSTTGRQQEAGQGYASNNSSVQSAHRVQVMHDHHSYTVHVGMQTPKQPYVADVLYVHGATFASDLSVFFKFGGTSWADALAQQGFRVWGFDFIGYGRSDRYLNQGTAGAPLGRAQDAAQQMHAVLAHIQDINGGKPVHLIAHSWGSVPALLVAQTNQQQLGRLVLFGPVAQRTTVQSVPAMGPARYVNVWEQYRRFIEDVPRGHPAVIADADIQAWSRAYLASDASSATRTPASVHTPNGPIMDLTTQWAGQSIYDLSKVQLPVLLVRGEWDSVCNDADAAMLLNGLASTIKQDLKIAKGTHLMHLESSRGQLHQASIEFLKAAPR